MEAPAPPLSIIVVDDNPVDVHLIRWVLDAHALPYELQVIDNGDSALDVVDHLAQQEPLRSPTIMLLDQCEGELSSVCRVHGGAIAAQKRCQHPDKTSLIVNHQHRHRGVQGHGSPVGGGRGTAGPHGARRGVEVMGQTDPRQRWCRCVLVHAPSYSKSRTTTKLF